MSSQLRLVTLGIRSDLDENVLGQVCQGIESKLASYAQLATNLRNSRQEQPVAIAAAPELDNNSELGNAYRLSM